MTLRKHLFHVCVYIYIYIEICAAFCFVATTVHQTFRREHPGSRHKKSAHAASIINVEVSRHLAEVELMVPELLVQKCVDAGMHDHGQP